MKLQESLPYCVVVGRKRYKLDPDFRNVLKMMEVLARDDLLPGAREYLAVKCVIRHPPKDAGPVLAEVRKLFFPERKEAAPAKKITSFEQDADLIRAAFRQAYGIDLYRDKLHWIEFSELLNALPEGSRYSEVLGIRARPMPKATKWNQEEREWLQKAKAQCALEMDDKEREANYSRCVLNVFSGLMSMAKGDGTDAGRAGSI